MNRLAVINGLRGFAILGVIYFHLLGVIFNRPGWMVIDFAGIPIMPLSYLSNGWLGVNLFFILSGFVLYLPYASAKRHFTNLSDVKLFFINRAKRLFPLYYLLLLISVLFILHQNNIYDYSFWKQLLLMSTFTFNFSKEMFIPPANYVLWSLGIEVLYSLVFPLLVMAIMKYGLKSVGIMVFSLSLFVRILSVQFPEYEVAPHLSMIKDSLLGRLDDFFVGMILAHLFINEWKKESIEKNAEFMFLLAILILTVGCYFSDYVFLKMISVNFEPFINTVFQLGFAVLTLSLLFMRNHFLRHVFTNKFIQLSGMMCYSLYLWHGNLRWFFFIDTSLFRVVVYLIFLFLLSFLTYRYIEFGNKKTEEILP